MKYRVTLALALSTAGALLLTSACNQDVTGPAPQGATTSAPSATQAAKVFKLDNEGFVVNWLLLDPIFIKDLSDHSEDTEKPILAKEYFKDQATVTPKADDKVRIIGAAAGEAGSEGKELKWREFKADDFQVDFEKFCADHNTDSNSCLFWGVTYVIAPEDTKDVKLAIGSDDSSVWWVNGKEVIRAYAGRAVSQDEDSSKPLTLNKGVNVIRFVVTQGDGPTGACARFLDAGDKPVKNLTVTLQPPAAK